MESKRKLHFLDEVNDFDSEQKAQVIDKFVVFLKEYIEPSFGSISKRDIDIKLFNILRDLHLISENPEIWEVISKLKITNAKARNLIYNANMQREDAFDNMDGLLQNVLKDVPYIKDGNYISIQIENPLLIDHVKSILKKEGSLSDGSFSPEIIKMKPEAFISVYLKVLPKEEREYFDAQYSDKKKCDSRKELAKCLYEEVKSLGSTQINALFSAAGILKKLIKKEYGDDVKSFFSTLEEERQKKELPSVPAKQ